MVPAIEVRQVWKHYLIRHNRNEFLKTRFLSLFHRRHREQRETFWALKGIDLVVHRGEALGLIGPNGSGKSTLLYLIAGTLVPTRGQVIVHGRVAPMIELGLGFHPELTGKENIYLSASLYGLQRRQIDRIYEDIVAFAGLERFIDVPLKNYSTGMAGRLGFAVAVHLDSDILLIDEVLAVGDERFQAKCLERMMAFRRQGKTIVFVSHAAEQVKLLCDRACLLRQGCVSAIGEVDEVLAVYQGKAAAVG